MNRSSDMSAESQNSGHRVSFMPDKYSESQPDSYTQSGVYPASTTSSYNPHQYQPSYEQQQMQTQPPFTQLAPPVQQQYSYQASTVATVEEQPVHTSSTMDVHQKVRNQLPKESVPWYLVPLGVLALFLCCFIGAFGLVYAVRARNAKEGGQSGRAEGFSTISFCFSMCAIAMGSCLLISIIVLAVVDDEYLSMFLI